MALVNQPSAAPTRKLWAVILSAIIVNTIFTLLRTYWPDHPFEPFLNDFGLWVTSLIMVITGYLTRDSANVVVTTTTVQRVDTGSTSGPSTVAVRKTEETAG